MMDPYLKKIGTNVYVGELPDSVAMTEDDRTPHPY